MDHYLQFVLTLCGLIGLLAIPFLHVAVLHTRQRPETPTTGSIPIQLTTKDDQ